MFNAIINRPNKIRDLQIKYQNEKAPTYMKGRGKLYFRAYLVLFGVSFLGSTGHLLSYVRGNAKRIGE